MNNQTPIEIFVENKFKVIGFFILTIIIAVFIYINYNQPKFNNIISIYTSIDTNEKNTENYLINLNNEILIGNNNLHSLMNQFKNKFLVIECSNIEKIYQSNFIKFNIAQCPSSDNFRLFSFEDNNNQLFTVNISNKDIFANVKREFNFFKKNLVDFKSIQLSSQDVEYKTFVNINMIKEDKYRYNINESKNIVNPIIVKLRELFNETLIDSIDGVQSEVERVIDFLNIQVDNLETELNFTKQSLYNNIISDLNTYYETKKFSGEYSNFWLNEVQTDQKPSAFIENAINNLNELQNQDLKQNGIFQEISLYKKNILEKNYDINFDYLRKQITDNDSYLTFDNISVIADKVFNKLPIFLVSFLFFSNLLFFTALLLFNNLRKK
tara:strand:- start:56 stop:1201 length:1146 start_codon:yes stop_codon:yes gene_type:complete